MIPKRYLLKDLTLFSTHSLAISKRQFSSQFSIHFYLFNCWEIGVELIWIEIGIYWHWNTFKLKEEIPFVTPENERVKSQIP